MKQDVIYDFVIIGAGVGGGAFLSRIAHSGKTILVLEQGDVLPSEASNWDPREILVKKRYMCHDTFIDKNNATFTPRMYYCVGGNSKVFGASSYRFREIDFEETRFANGLSPAWPISYSDLSPYYDIAEQAMHVCGKIGDDPSEPPRAEYAYAAYPHEPYIQELANKLAKRGLKPFHLPVAIDSTRCRKGSPCDGFPCRIKAKHDAETSFIRPALKAHDNIKLQTNAYVERLELAGDGKNIASALVIHDAKKVNIRAKYFILAAGAINSALLLLRSKSRCFPRGIANTNDQVGRNYMTHINSVIMGIHPFRKNPTKFQKTLAINDYYLQLAKNATRLGSIQTRGKIQAENLQAHPKFWMRLFKKFIAEHSVDFWVMTEDLPSPDNRVYYDTKGLVHLDQVHTNIDAHNELIGSFSSVLKQIGYTWVHTELRATQSVQHQCGTIRFGTDEKLFPLNAQCRAFEVNNLYAVDASVFPSSAALNPALTIAANALRVADIIKKDEK